jgi:PDZ domain
MNGQKQDLIKRSTAELLALESRIEDVLKGQLGVVQPHPQAAAAVQQFRFMTKSHRDALEAYLQTIGGSSLEHPDTTIPSLSATDDTHWFPISDALRYDFMLFNYAAISYARLVEIAFKLYDPALRKIGPQHLEGYAEAVRTINRMIAGVIGWELEQEELWCECICPMCSIGACGCVAVGTGTVKEAWHLETPTEEAVRGFPLQRPKPGSQLALAGVQAGDRLVSVDDQTVQTFSDIQAAIRKHEIGEEFTVWVQRGTDTPREIRVKHVSDYSR